MNDLSTNDKTGNILIVDDTPANLDILSEMLRLRGYTIRPVTSGRQALDTAMISPPDIILLDINMPKMNGYEVCELLKSNVKLNKIPVIFISALNETIDRVKAFSVGGVDYITKPFQYEEVLARVDAHLKISNLQCELEKHNLNLEELVKEKIKELYESQMATILALSELAESRDDDTGKHLDRVQIYCKRLAMELSKNDNYRDIINKSYIDNIFLQVQCMI
jgi:putative two-component system response regulator